MINEEVLLIHTDYMNKVLEKVYAFTHKANSNIFEPSNPDWPDSAIVFTKRFQREGVRNASIGGGGPTRSNNRIVARRRYAHEQYSHIFQRNFNGQ